jgi:Ca-activated chloride channel family protein
MKRRIAAQVVLVVSAVSFLALLSAGPNRGQEPGYTIRSDVRLVLLDVSVKDHSGNFVSGLTKDNFTVFEDGRRQELAVFSGNDLPVTVGILVDESYSMTPKRVEVLTAAQTFIRQSNPQDQMFVLNFNDRVTAGLPPGVPFSGNMQQLRSALQQGKPAGKTALYDAVVDGLKQLQLGRRERKALIVISDGGDNASRHARREMLDMVERSAAAIYAIGVFDPQDPDRDPGVLWQMARISGGVAYFPPEAAGVIPACEGIARDMRARYTVGYNPPVQQRMKSLRHVQVRVSGPGGVQLTAHTRSTYRYDEGGHEEK